MTRDATTSFARTLVDEWARAGVTDAVLAPGSRSAPLALALAADDRITVHVHVDERSAGGFALGLARGSGRPAILVCTSGTAAALYHSAVLEAHHGRVPLRRVHRRSPPGAPRRRRRPDDRAARPLRRRAPLVRRPGTARGPARGGCGVAWDRRPCRRRGDRSTRRARAPQPRVPRAARPDGRAARRRAGTSRRSAVDRRRAVARTAPDAATVERARGLRAAASARRVVVAGADAAVEPSMVARFADVAGWPVLADPLSGLRVGEHAVSTYDAIAPPRRRRRLRPEPVLRLGAPPTSKALAGWLVPRRPDVARRSGRAVARPVARRVDPFRVRSAVSCSRGGRSLERTLRRYPDWRRAWCDAERRARCGDRRGLRRRATSRSRVASRAISWPRSRPERRSSSRRACRCATSRRSRHPAPASTSSPTAASTASTASCRPCSVSLRPGTGHRSSRCWATSASSTTRTASSASLDGASTSVLVVVDNDGGGIFSFLPPATTPMSASRLRGALRHAARCRSRSARRGARSALHRGRACIRSRRRRPRRDRRGRCADGSGAAPTARPTSPATAPSWDAVESALPLRQLCAVAEVGAVSRRGRGSSARASPAPPTTRRRRRSRRRCPLPHAACRVRTVDGRPAERDRPLAIAVGVDPADRSRVAVTWVRLERGDRRERRRAWASRRRPVSDGARGRS